MSREMDAALTECVENAADAGANICPECGHDISVMCADGRAERENGEACQDADCPMMEEDAPPESEADAAAAKREWDGLTDGERAARIREAGK